MRFQKGKILNWIIFIILIVIILGLLIYLQSRKKVEEPVAPKLTEKLIEETKITKPRKTFAVSEFTEEQKGDRDNNAFNQALLSGKGCEEIKFDEKLKQLCFDTLAYNEAIRDKNETLCEKIKDAELKTKCLDQVYLSVAIKNSDTSICEKITDKDIKQNCFDQIIALSGISVKSAAECNAVKDFSLKKTCLDNFYYNESIAALDKSGCEKIIDIALKERCMTTISHKAIIAEAGLKQAEMTYQSTEEKIQTCNTLNGDAASSCKNEVNYNLAFEKKDLSYCNNITDGTLKNNCVQTQSISINSYYLKNAVRLKDKSLCNKITDSTLRNTCSTSIQ